MLEGSEIIPPNKKRCFLICCVEIIIIFYSTRDKLVLLEVVFGLEDKSHFYVYLRTFFFLSHFLLANFSH